MLGVMCPPKPPDYIDLIPTTTRKLILHTCQNIANLLGQIFFSTFLVISIVHFLGILRTTKSIISRELIIAKLFLRVSEYTTLCFFLLVNDMQTTPILTSQKEPF